MFYAETVGLPTVLARVKQYREQFGDYWKPAALLEKVKLPLEEKAYYLMLSNAYVADNPAYAARIWDEIERQRESVTYRQQVRDFLARSQP